MILTIIQIKWKGPQLLLKWRNKHIQPANLLSIKTGKIQIKPRSYPISLSIADKTSHSFATQDPLHPIRCIVNPRRSKFLGLRRHGRKLIKLSLNQSYQITTQEILILSSSSKQASRSQLGTTSQWQLHRNATIAPKTLIWHREVYRQDKLTANSFSWQKTGHRSTSKGRVRQRKTTFQELLSNHNERFLTIEIL